MDTGNTLEQVFSIGRRAGLSDEEVERATGRIAASVASVTGASEGQPGRMMQGLATNMSDNPMLVAWGLKVAARTADRVWEKFCDNFLVGIVYERKQVVEALQRELGHHPPVTLVVNPTMRCNLRCKGCYAYSYDKKADMDRDVLVRLIAEARDLGVQFLTMTGGEPFMYKDLEGIFDHFSDMIFMVYTNGQFIDAARARRLAELGNVWPTISVEGYEQETDERRGRGVYRRILEAMEHLRQNGVLFGISAVPTRYNTELMASDEFLHHYMELGALFGWMFTYMPVGRDPDPELMATPAQRELLRQTSLRWRRNEPFFMADFWNDGPLCGGCMSGNRFAFVTTDGWIQPCVFVHFATHNIHDCTLRDAFESELFRTIRGRQPYHPNLLRPCKIIDHPHVLREVVAATGARPTYPGADAIIKDPAVCAHLDAYSREVGRIADRAWASEDYCAGRAVQVPFYGKVDLYRIYDWRMKTAHAQPGAPAEIPPVPGEAHPRRADARGADGV